MKEVPGSRFKQFASSVAAKLFAASNIDTVEKKQVRAVLHWTTRRVVLLSFVTRKIPCHCLSQHVFSCVCASTLSTVVWGQKVTISASRKTQQAIQKGVFSRDQKFKTLLDSGRP